MFRPDRRDDISKSKPAFEAAGISRRSPPLTRSERITHRFYSGTLVWCPRCFLGANGRCSRLWRRVDDRTVLRWSERGRMSTRRNSKHSVSTRYNVLANGQGRHNMNMLDWFEGFVKIRRREMPEWKKLAVDLTRITKQPRFQNRIVSNEFALYTHTHTYTYIN